VNDSPGCVVVNEPAAIFAPLASQPVPYGVGLHHAELRSAILDGRPIANKLHNGEFIEDTAVVDTVESYMPDVAAPDFLLGTKNTLAYMARLPHLEAAMPRALIVACVRHPEDTIASWKSTFPHLREADLEGQVLGHSRDPLLDDASRARLREIAATSEAPRRRALLWCHLALLLLEAPPRVLRLRYEDIVANPAQALEAIFARFPQGTPLTRAGAGPAVSAPRSKRSVLDADDLAAIRAICAPAAARLGYTLDKPVATPSGR
jgi:hypothetical protein